MLVGVRVPGCREAVDVLTPDGVRSAGLPVTYPRNPNGSWVGHGRCQRIGVQAQTEGHAGVLARSAATVDGAGQELACWGGLDPVERVGRPLPYGRWRRELPPLPTFDGGGLMPGFDLDDMSSVADVLDV